MFFIMITVRNSVLSYKMEDIITILYCESDSLVSVLSTVILLRNIHVQFNFGRGGAGTS